MSKHTPGPWELHKPAFGEQHIYVNSGHTVHGMKAKSGRQHICVVPYEGKRGAIAYHEMFNANARLIAAAPDLLEALKAAYIELHYCSQQLVASGWTEGSTVRAALDGARAAIAKVTGGAA